jgi:(S)-ureidoglycine aminohydrolase
MDAKMLMPSRGCVAHNYFLMTPDNFVANGLPHFAKTVARLLTTPRGTAARFGQYLLEFESGGGSLRPQGAGFESFLYQIAGHVVVGENGTDHDLKPGDYCYLPAGTEFSIQASASAAASTLWTKRRYEQVEGIASPTSVFANQAEAAEIVPPPPGRYTYRELLPAANTSYDFAMNVLTAQPGGSIGMIEIHHQEHGLLMLSGRGVYYLAGDFHEVARGDYIYMAPYCPQTFYGIGDEPTSYLLYKDVNRDGF